MIRRKGSATKPLDGAGKFLQAASSNQRFGRSLNAMFPRASRIRGISFLLIY